MGERSGRVAEGTLCPKELEFFNERNFGSCFHNGLKPCSCGVNVERALGREFGLTEISEMKDKFNEGLLT